MTKVPVWWSQSWVSSPSTTRRRQWRYRRGGDVVTEWGRILLLTWPLWRVKVFLVTSDTVTSRVGHRRFFSVSFLTSHPVDSLFRLGPRTERPCGRDENTTGKNFPANKRLRVKGGGEKVGRRRLREIEEIRWCSPVNDSFWSSSKFPPYKYSKPGSKLFMHTMDVEETHVPVFTQILH